MAFTELKMKESNVKCHLDIENYLAERKNGLVTFTLRVNDGNIVDFVHTEYVPVQKRYFDGKVGEFRISIENGRPE